MRSLQVGTLPGQALLLAIAACALGSGCQTVNSELTTLFGEAPAASSPVPVAPGEAADADKCLVELRESGRKPELMPFPLTESMYVQQALDQSGATKRFRRMKIQLYRHLPGGGGHRLDIPFDRSTRKVPPGDDYALHPKDRLVVTEDTSTVLDDMLNGISAPITKGGKS